MRILFLAFILTGCAAFTPTQPAPGLPVTVSGVDIPRYLGTWYEAARLPVAFQDGPGLRCVDVTAVYSPRPDGTLDVVNTCRNAEAGGAIRSASAIASVVPGSGNARLRVAFFWPFHGDYWVIGLDPEYRWAVVGAPSRRVLWVLSRSTSMTETDYARAVDIARGQGFDVARLVWTEQSVR